VLCFPYSLDMNVHYASPIRFGNHLVPAAFLFFVGILKAREMTNKNSKKPKMRNDIGDIFTKQDLPEKIGKNLRQIYDDVLNEPVPDDFLSLLMQADEKSK